MALLSREIASSDIATIAKVVSRYFLEFAKPESDGHLSTSEAERALGEFFDEIFLDVLDELLDILLDKGYLELKGGKTYVSKRFVLR